MCELQNKTPNMGYPFRNELWAAVEANQVDVQLWDKLWCELGNELMHYSISVL
jgi:hypothetical protein